MSCERPRYTHQSLPPYSYVPGHSPHPVSDPAGHMHGQAHQPAEPLLSTHWQASHEYLYGVDLFNHGFYWESHEAWESLWHAARRRGPLADFLKGLIKLSAAGVKMREGNVRGVWRHAQRAKALLAPRLGTIFCGISIDHVNTFAEALSNNAEQYPQPQPQLCWEFVLVLAHGGFGA